uniref:Uncharacterized protein n=1 Tax=viral metagenome TaxID=1070528 RepID=A0A6C0CBC6_9ZZZZ
MQSQLTTYPKCLEFTYFESYINSLKNANFHIDIYHFGTNFESNTAEFLKKIDEYCDIPSGASDAHSNMDNIDALCTAISSSTIR